MEPAARVWFVPLFSVQWSSKQTVGCTVRSAEEPGMGAPTLHRRPFYPHVTARLQNIAPSAYGHSPGESQGSSPFSHLLSSLEN